MATSFHQELELLRKEMQEQMNTMSRRHDREMQSLKKENIKILDDVDALRSKNDSLELELAQTKKLLNQLKAEFESMKRQPSPLQQTGTTQTLSLGATAGTEMTTHSSSPFCTAGPSDVRMTTQSSTTGATAAPSSAQKTTKRQKPKDIKRIQQTSLFNVRVLDPRRLDYNSPTPVRVDRYNLVITDSECMDVRTGVYTTPYGGRYRFKGSVFVMRNGKISVFVCGSDGRREMVLDRLSGWMFGHVLWDCPKDMTVWIEVVGDSDCDRDTRFKAVFEGWLED